MTIRNWSTTASSNNSSPPNGWPENMALSDVNNSARQGMADVRDFAEELPWFDYGHTPTRTGNTTFTIATDVTAIYHANRRIKCTDSTTLYGTIASASYSAPNTTVTVTLDSGNLSASLTKVAVSITGVTNKSITGDMVVGGVVTTTGIETLTNKTLTSPKVNQILDSNGNEEVIFTTTASAVNEFTLANAATGTNPNLSATGGDTNIGIDIQPKGTGVVNVKGTATASAEVRLFEDTDNGSNYVGLKAAASTTSSYTMGLPAALPSTKKGVTIDASGNVGFDGTGRVLQTVSSVSGAVATGTTVIPDDDTIPQNTEGDQYYSVSITPSSATSVLVIDATVNMASTVGNQLIVALFQDSTADALAVGVNRWQTVNKLQQVSLKHTMAAGTTSAITFKVRAGSSAAGTTTVNGESGSRKFGGALASGIIITEYEA